MAAIVFADLWAERLVAPQAFSQPRQQLWEGRVGQACVLQGVHVVPATPHVVAERAVVQRAAVQHVTVAGVQSKAASRCAVAHVIFLADVDGPSSCSAAKTVEDNLHVIRAAPARLIQQRNVSG